jgi:hypothetical protein
MVTGSKNPSTVKGQIVKVLLTDAGSNPLLPSWLAVIVHVPTAVMVTEALFSVSVTLQLPLALKETG